MTEANQQKPLLGLVCDGNMPVRARTESNVTAISISPHLYA
ncbi:hypothetical protein ACLK1S_02410 [Escherichia coli]